MYLCLRMIAYLIRFVSSTHKKILRLDITVHKVVLMNKFDPVNHLVS